MEENNKMIHELELAMLKELDAVSKKYNIKYFLSYGSALGAVRHSGFIPWDTDVDVIVNINEYDELCRRLHEEISDKFKLEHIMFDSDYDSLKARMSIKGQSNLIIHIDIFPIVGLPKYKVLQKIFITVAYLNYRLYFIKKVKPNINYRSNPYKRKIAKLLKLLLFLYPTKLSIFLYNKMKSMYPIESADHVYNICGSYGRKEIMPKKWFYKQKFIEFEDIILPVPIEYDKYLRRIYNDYTVPRKTDYV